jgi:hypothetical protein
MHCPVVCCHQVVAQLPSLPSTVFSIALATSLPPPVHLASVKRGTARTRRSRKARNMIRDRAATFPLFGSCCRRPSNIAVAHDVMLSLPPTYLRSRDVL